MPLFSCRVGSPDGAVLEKEINANTKDDALQKLRASGYHIFEVKKKINLKVKSKSISMKDFLVFNQEFYALCKAGIPIFNGLNILVKRIKNQNFKALLEDIIIHVKEGKSLSGAFAEMGSHFPAIYPSILLAGEQSGNLTGVLENYISYERLLFSTKKKVKSAFIYPFFLIVVAVITIGIIISYVLPKFADFYKGFGKELPYLTRLVTSVSLKISDHFLLIAGCLVILTIILRSFFKSDRGKLTGESIIQLTPVIREIWKKYILSQFTRTLSILIEGGIPVVNAVDTLAFTNPSSMFSNELKHTAAAIRTGSKISDSLENSVIVDELTLDMIRIGEETGNLSMMLKNASDYHDDDLHALLNGVVSLVAPAVLLVMGCLIAVILIAMYMPLFEVSDIVS